MYTRLFLSAFLLLFFSLLSAQTTTELRTGELVSRNLPNEEVHKYTLDLEKGTFINGFVDQLTVDVVVTVFDPAGHIAHTFDNPARGPEPFQFDSEAAGKYRIEVSPFKEEEGDYTIQISKREPTATSPAVRVDQLMSAYDNDHTPGVAVGVYQNGEVIFSQTYGMANLVHDIPFELDMPSNIGSVSKQFTAMAILLLEQQGILSLDDDVRKHLPELPDLGETITLRHLLTHTNGLRELYNTLPMRAWNGQDFLRREEAIGLIQRQEALQASPGEEFRYNNTAFALLATIVERLTETDFPEWMKANVFAPLGMDHTYVRKNPKQIIPHATQGYSASRDGGYEEAGDLHGAYGAGGIYTTVEDLGRWLANFREPQIGGEEAWTKLVTPYILNNGDTSSYALGIGVGEQRGLKRYSHGGADIAHRAMLVYYPEIDAGVSIMSNNAGFDAGISNAVADAFFGELMDPKEEPESMEEPVSEEEGTLSLTEEQLRRYTGKFKLEAAGMIIEYTLEDGQLRASATGQPTLNLQPIGRHEFKYDMVDARVVFEVEGTGDVNKATHFQGGGEHQLIRVPDFDPTEEELAAYAGLYFSEELQTVYRIIVEEGQLKARHINMEDIELTPVEEDAFSGNVFFINEMAFLRDVDGTVTGFSISNGRTRGVQFVRWEE